MCASRLARRSRARVNRRRLHLAGGIALTAALVVALGLGYCYAGSAESSHPDPAPSTVAELADAASQDETVEVQPPQVVEVPDVRGKSLAEAEMVMSLAGLAVERVADEDAERDADRTVVSQEPLPGVKLEAGSTVVLRHALESSGEAAKATTQYVVGLDPGHQSRSNTAQEPIGPGSSETKAKVTGGTQGVLTRLPEYELTLVLSNKVKDRLEERGVEVVMTRTKHDVDISNSERAKVCNEAGADLVVRVHADGSPDRTVHGISALHPAVNKWTKPIAERSAKAARLVQARMVAATGAKDLGLHERGDITGFNWSKVPVILVEAGFMSNPDEDKRLSTEAYQDKLADAIVEGVMAYLEG